jgi:hypothetical protein
VIGKRQAGRPAEMTEEETSCDAGRDDRDDKKSKAERQAEMIGKRQAGRQAEMI